MSQEFQPGDFLIFQLESGFGLLRVLAFDNADEKVWHVSAYEDLFLDTEMAESAIGSGEVKVNIPHVALTERAFLSTQVARLGYRDLSDDELAAFRTWQTDPEKQISDRSIRLMLGLR